MARAARNLHADLSAQEMRVILAETKRLQNLRQFALEYFLVGEMRGNGGVHFLRRTRLCNVLKINIVRLQCATKSLGHPGCNVAAHWVLKQRNQQALNFAFGNLARHIKLARDGGWRLWIQRIKLRRQIAL